MSETRPIKVLLICAGGLSTSLLRQSIPKAAGAASVSMELSWDALDMLSMHDFESEAVDVILLAPQVHFMRKSIAKKVERFGIVVQSLDPMAFGMMDGAKLLHQIQDALAARSAKT